MVDQINKIHDNAFRVHEAKDSTEEEEQRPSNEEADGEPDVFDSLANKTNWKILFDKSNLWDRNVEVKIEDIDRIKLLGINLKTNPALLKLRVFLFDGEIINTAFLSVSRSLGLKIKNSKDASINVNDLTNERSLWLTLPTDENLLDEEITRITSIPKEVTLSQTFRMLISKRNWMQRFGIQDPVSRRTNMEILWIYVTVVLLIAFGVFTVLYLRG